MKSTLPLTVALAIAGCGEAAVAPDAHCGFSDSEPNDDAAHATIDAPGSVHRGCLASADDVDHILIGPSRDGTGGIIRATIAGAGAVRVVVYDDAGPRELARFSADAPGAALGFFVAVSAARPAHIAVTGDGGAPPFTYELTSEYEPVPDAFEPNDTGPAAAPMIADTPVHGYLFAGAGEPAAAFDDYYRFSARGGNVRVSLEDVPADLAARLILLRGDGTEVARASRSESAGALGLELSQLLEPADYLIRIALSAEAPAASGRGDALPEHFTHPYRLTVTQP